MKTKLRYHLFTADTHETAYSNARMNWTGQTTGVGEYTSAMNLSPEMKTFYDKALLRCAEPKLVHDQFGQKRPIPAGNGKIIEFRKFYSLSKALTPLTEGITPAGQSVGVLAITATVSQYGGYVMSTDMLNLTAFDNTMAEITKLLGSQAGRTSDTITRNILVTGTNVSYADHGNDGNNDRTDIGADDVLTIADIKKAVRKLKRVNAETIQGDFVAIVHPDTAFDLMNDDEWVEANQYAGSTKIFEGEIGKMYGVRFVETSEAKIWKDSTCPTVSSGVYRPVYGTLVLAANAFGVTSINGGGIQTIAKQLGSAGSADPLDQRSTMGWKLNKVATILNQDYMVRIEHAASFGQDAEAN